MITFQSHLQEQTVTIFYIEANGFPAGINEAWQRLNTLLNGKKDGRAFYGISFFDANGEAVYRAAASELYTGEADKFQLPTYTIPQGQYFTRLVQPSSLQKRYEIALVFDLLLQRTDVATSSPCIEWYRNMEEILCMVLKKKPALQKIKQPVTFTDNCKTPT